MWAYGLQPAGAGMNQCIGFDIHTKLNRTFLQTIRKVLSHVDIFPSAFDNNNNNTNNNDNNNNNDSNFDE